MSNKTVIHTAQAPKALGPYSQAIVMNNFVYCSGQLGLNPASMELVSDSVVDQAHQALENLKAVLLSAGSSPSAVVKTTIFLTNIADFPLVNEVYATFFIKDPPARSTVAVQALPKGGRVEIEAIASLTQ